MRKVTLYIFSGDAHEHPWIGVEINNNAYAYLESYARLNLPRRGQTAPEDLQFLRRFTCGPPFPEEDA